MKKRDDFGWYFVFFFYSYHFFRDHNKLSSFFLICFSRDINLKHASAVKDINKSLLQNFSVFPYQKLSETPKGSNFFWTQNFSDISVQYPHLQLFKNVVVNNWNVINFLFAGFMFRQTFVLFLFAFFHTTVFFGIL